MTEREIVLRERAAFLAGLNSCLVHDTYREKFAAERYPLPKITRPRILKDENGYAWAMFDGKLNHASDPGGNFVESECVCPTPTRIKIWADLLANPNETVDA